MKINYFILFFLMVFYTKAQQIPFDTSFYSKGEIKSIRYKYGERYGEAIIRYFKQSVNKLDKNQPIVDTAFWDNDPAKKEWKKYQGGTRIFIYNKSYLFMEKSTFKDSYTYNTIQGSYEYYFKELNNLEFDIAYTKDTSITFFRLGIYDTTGGGKPLKDKFFFSRYKGMKMDTGESNHIYKCGNYGTVYLTFSKYNLLATFFFYPNNEQNSAVGYEFYPNFFCKKHGHCFGRLAIGEWQEYHENGNIKSIGNYEIYDEKSFKNYRKVGLWQYFDNRGLSIKKETWKNGVLLK